MPVRVFSSPAQQVATMRVCHTGSLNTKVSLRREGVLINGQMCRTPNHRYYVYTVPTRCSKGYVSMGQRGGRLAVPRPGSCTCTCADVRVAHAGYTFSCTQYKGGAHRTPGLSSLRLKLRTLCSRARIHAPVYTPGPRSKLLGFLALKYD